MHVGRKKERTWGCIGIDREIFSLISSFTTSEEFISGERKTTRMDEYVMTGDIASAEGTGFMGVYTRFTGDGQHEAYLRGSDYMRRDDEAVSRRYAAILAPRQRSEVALARFRF